MCVIIGEEPLIEVHEVGDPEASFVPPLYAFDLSGEFPNRDLWVG
jgi:hypothetical protein